MLDLLSGRPMHPYEMRSTLRARGMDKVIKIRGASLYDTVERHARDGLIEPVETSREGRRPERTVYALTEVGRDELQDRVRAVLSRPADEFPEFAAGLASILNLSPAEALGVLNHRVVALEAGAAADERILRLGADGELPPIFLVEIEYTRAMKLAEARWVRDLVGRLRDGSLKWVEGADRDSR